MENYFTELNAVNVNDKTEKKNGLTYLSWAWAWAEVKKLHPDANYTIYENAQGWFYHSDGRTCWVKTGVTVQGIEHIEYLPVMDFRNASIPVEKVTSFDVNKAIQRSLTKAAARHGLGLYIYAGEDLPEGADAAVAAPVAAPKAQPAVDTQDLKIKRMTLIAADAAKYLGTKDKAKIRDSIAVAEEWMKANMRYNGASYEAMTVEEFAQYLKAMHEFYNPAGDRAVAV